MKNLRIVKKIITFITSTVLAVAFMTTYSDSFSTPYDVSAKTLAEIQEARKENEAKIAEYEEKISALEENKNTQQEYQDTLNQSIALVQENITLLNEELQRISDDITAAEENINTLNESIGEQQKKVDENIEIFKERLCAMYISGNNSLASAILGSTDFYDMLSRMEMVNSIAAHDEELVNEILSEIEALEKSKSDLETEKLTLEAKKDEQELKKADKQKEIDDLNELVKKTQSEIDRLALEQESVNKDIEELEKEQAEYDQMEAEIQEAIRKAAEEQKLKEQQAAANNSNNNSQTSNPNSNPSYVTPNPGATGFMWPTPGFYYISSYYGSRWGKLHAGIDIGDSGIGGASVVAAQSGTVAYVYSSCTHNYPKSYNCCGGGYGNYVIISHDGTYSTLYGHLSYVNVSVGDYVSQGQVIGAAGCTGHSTGDHLHFEVRVNGIAQDPLNYVSP